MVVSALFLALVIANAVLLITNGYLHLRFGCDIAFDESGEEENGDAYCPHCGEDIRGVCLGRVWVYVHRCEEE